MYINPFKKRVQILSTITSPSNPSLRTVNHPLTTHITKHWLALSQSHPWVWALISSVRYNNWKMGPFRAPCNQNQLCHLGAAHVALGGLWHPLTEVLGVWRTPLIFAQCDNYIWWWWARMCACACAGQTPSLHGDNDYRTSTIIVEASVAWWALVLENLHSERSTAEGLLNFRLLNYQKLFIFKFRNTVLFFEIRILEIWLTAWCYG